MQPESGHFLLVACALTHLACAPRELPPPQAPARDIPPVEPRIKAPPAEQTRVLLDANGQRAKVTEVAAWSSTFAAASEGSRWGSAFGYSDFQRPVCLTPCLADFSPGLHRLLFVTEDGKHTGGVDIQVSDQAKVLRIALGRNEPSRGSQAGALALIVSGAAVMLVGGLLAATASTSDAPDQADAEQRGLISFGTGAAAMLIGLPWLLSSRGVHQESTVTEFEYEPAPPPPPPPPPPAATPEDAAETAP